MENSLKVPNHVVMTILEGNERRLPNIKNHLQRVDPAEIQVVTSSA